MTVRVVEMRVYHCNVCGAALRWDRVSMFGVGSFVLIHPKGLCRHGRKRLYAPGSDLEEITPDMWKAARASN